MGVYTVFNYKTKEVEDEVKAFTAKGALDKFMEELDSEGVLVDYDKGDIQVYDDIEDPDKSSRSSFIKKYYFEENGIDFEGEVTKEIVYGRKYAIFV